MGFRKQELDENELHKLKVRASRIAMSLLSQPLENPIGREKLSSIAGSTQGLIHKPPNMSAQTFDKQFRMGGRRSIGA